MTFAEELRDLVAESIPKIRARQLESIAQAMRWSAKSGERTVRISCEDYPLVDAFVLRRFLEEMGFDENALKISGRDYRPEYQIDLLYEAPRRYKDL